MSEQTAQELQDRLQRERIRLVLYRHHELVASLRPTQDELDGWLDTMSLPVSKRKEIQRQGPPADWNISRPYTAKFRDYMLNQRKLQLVEYMAEHLSPEDYFSWLDNLSDDMLNSLSDRS